MKKPITLPDVIRKAAWLIVFIGGYLLGRYIQNPDYTIASGTVYHGMHYVKIMGEVRNISLDSAYYQLVNHANLRDCRIDSLCKPKSKNK